jgi:hypothetical protein
MVHARGTDDIMNRKNTRGERLSGRAAVLGLGLVVLGVFGCGESPAPVPPKIETATQSAPASAKKSTKTSRLEAPNADLGPKERRALKAKGQLPQ